MTLLESIAKPFLQRKPENEPEYSSTPTIDNIDQELTNLDDIAPTGFFDGTQGGFFSTDKKQSSVKKQIDLINQYRRIANSPEVESAITEIVNESVFTPTDQKHPIQLDYSDTNTSISLQDTVKTEFEEIANMVNIEKNLPGLFKQFYIDGQLNIHCAYDESKIKEGIQKLRIINPLGLYFNYSKERWEYEKEYKDNLSYISRSNNIETFDKEEIIRIDSGEYHDQLILGYLHKAIKPANMLQTLEDMLIPMRFSRSVSRRVFNVDVGGLNNKKAEEVMNKTQAKFKYKKFYDVEAGTIANQQHVAALTEDYWFPNRDGQKGTQVDTIDETGNLGELSDILYFKRKLYTALKVPTDRINDEESTAVFTFDDTSNSREEIKFYAYVSNIRKSFLQVFYELLKRQLIAKGLVTLEEWKTIEKNLIIRFSTENVFFDKMQRETLSDRLDQYSNIEDYVGKLFSHRFIFKEIFKLTDDGIKELADEIEAEKTDPMYKRFYAEAKGDDKSW